MLKKQPERDVAMKRQPGVVEAKSHEWKQEIHLWVYTCGYMNVFWNYDDDGTDDDPNIVFSSVCCLLSSPLFFPVKDILVDH